MTSTRREFIKSAGIAIARSHLSDEQTWALYDRLAISDSYNLPRFDELGLDSPPDAAQAARFLIELLLE